MGLIGCGDKMRREKYIKECTTREVICKKKLACNFFFIFKKINMKI